MGRYELAQDQVAAFEKAVRNNAQMFGLTDWLIRFEWVDETADDRFAQVQIDVASRSATFQTSRHWPEPATSRNIDRVAYHEILEVMLAPICAIARLDQNEVTAVGKMILLESECHAIIRRLENLYMGSR